MKYDFKKLLNDGYNEVVKREEDYNCRTEVLTKQAYLSDYIFDITTYSDELSDFYGEKCIEICKAMRESETFEYINDEENYKWFIILLNIPFFADRINWGTSIRGAWFEGEGEYESTGLYSDDKQIWKFVFTHEDFEEFIDTVIEFANEN